ncbi:hypothetical protein ES703_84740 [subsurface metagenome]
MADISFTEFLKKYGSRSMPLTKEQIELGEAMLNGRTLIVIPQRSGRKLLFEAVRKYREFLEK